MKNIPIYKLKFEDSYISEFQKGVEQILTSDSITESVFVRKFESEFGKLVNSKYCLAVPNGTAALELALRAIDIRGKKVISPSNTFFATTIAITNCGGIIELIDIEPESLSICPKQLRKKISKETGAVILVHIGGIISKYYEEIRTICNEYNIPLIEDAAHAHLSNVNGEYAGTIGDIGCFSFFPTKVMTTGQGGMVTTNNPEYNDALKSLKNFGRDNPDSVRNTEAYCTNEQGDNFRISEFTGLMGYLECNRVKKRIDKRNELLVRYAENLNGTSFFTVTQDSGYCSYYKCILKTKINRDVLSNYCEKKNVGLTGEVYRTPVHQQPLYIKIFEDEKFPITDDFCTNHICPPLYPELSLNEVDYICEVLLNAEKELYSI